MQKPILEQSQLEAQSVSKGGMSITPQFLPEAIAPYAARAARFSQLASGHALEAYLNFCAALCAAQEAAAKQVPVSLPACEAAHWRDCAAQGVAPLSFVPAQLGAGVSMVLAHLVKTLESNASLTAPVRQTLKQLDVMSSSEVGSFADKLQGGQWADIDRAQAPFIGAALQVWFNRLACQLVPMNLNFPPEATREFCPVCGSGAVASVIRAGQGGLCYQHCGVCETQWHTVRGACTQCHDNSDIAYWSLEGIQSAMRAESCGACHTYVKLLNPENAPAADVLADDLASLALDMAMDENGFARVGANLLFFPG